MARTGKLLPPLSAALLFPQSKSLGLDQGEVSAAILEKITYAGVAARSFRQASEVLEKLADLPIAEKQVERVTERIGAERVAERDAEVASYQALPLSEKFAVPAGVTPPALAVVMVDGGRMQILDRRSKGEKPAASAGPAEPWDGDEERDGKAGHWREDKVGLLLVMDSVASARDPCPAIPPSFVDATRIPKLVRELQKSVKAPADAAADAADPEAVAEALAVETVYEPPKVCQRKAAASRACWPSFASQVVAAAWALGFQGARRRAFVGDGSANNWTLQRRFFASFVPILDFIHALSYVFAAAQAGRKFAAGWAYYQEWIAWVWQGQVSRVIAALEQRQAELGLPDKDEAEGTPRQVVAKTL